MQGGGVANDCQPRGQRNLKSHLVRARLPGAPPCLPGAPRPQSCSQAMPGVSRALLSARSPDAPFWARLPYARPGRALRLRAVPGAPFAPLRARSTGASSGRVSRGATRVPPPTQALICLCAFAVAPRTSSLRPSCFIFFGGVPLQDQGPPEIGGMSLSFLNKSPHSRGTFPILSRDPSFYKASRNPVKTTGCGPERWSKRMEKESTPRITRSIWAVGRPSSPAPIPGTATAPTVQLRTGNAGGLRSPGNRGGGGVGPIAGHLGTVCHPLRSALRSFLGQPARRVVGSSSAKRVSERESRG